MEMLKEFLWRNIKYISLVILVVQNAALVLTMRYSRTVSEGKMYLASTAVVLTELMKFIISVSVIFYNSKFDAEKAGKLLYIEIIVKVSETAKVSVPSVLYTIQNNLLYVALSHLNAVTFQVSRFHKKEIFNIIFCLSGYVSAEDPHDRTVLCFPPEEESEWYEVVVLGDSDVCRSTSAGMVCCSVMCT